MITCGSLITTMLSIGKPFRAAIEIGVGIDHQEYGFYGSAVSNAYLIESKIADYPRILIGPLLYNYISTCSSLPKSLLIGKHRFPKKLIVETSKNILKMLIPVENDCYMLDFLGEYFIEIFEIAGMKQCAIDAYEKVINSIEFFTKEQPSEKLFGKYQKLKTYFDSRIGNWIK
jgi:hypothetical protein